MPVPPQPLTCLALPCSGLPPHHWRQVLQGLGLAPQQKQHITTSYQHMLQQVGPLLEARHQLGVQLAAAAKPTTFSWVHMVQRELQVRCSRRSDQGGALHCAA
jgi:hypothetical protein